MHVFLLHGMYCDHFALDCSLIYLFLSVFFLVLSRYNMFNQEQNQHQFSITTVSESVTTTLTAGIRVLTDNLSVSYDMIVEYTQVTHIVWVTVGGDPIFVIAMIQAQVRALVTVDRCLRTSNNVIITEVTTTPCEDKDEIAKEEFLSCSKICTTPFSQEEDQEEEDEQQQQLLPKRPLSIELPISAWPRCRQLIHDLKSAITGHSNQLGDCLHKVSIITVSESVTTTLTAGFRVLTDNLSVSYGMVVEYTQVIHTSVVTVGGEPLFVICMIQAPQVRTLVAIDRCLRTSNDVIITEVTTTPCEDEDEVAEDKGLSCSKICTLAFSPYRLYESLPTLPCVIARSLCSGKIPTLPFSAEEFQSMKHWQELTQSIALLVDTSADWKQRKEAMRVIGELVCNSNITTLPGWEASMIDLCTAITQQLGDLRSEIVKQACALVNIISKAMGEDFEDSLSYFLPTLFNKVYVTKTAISSPADQCIRALMRQVPTCKSLSVLLEAARDPHAILRQRVSEYTLLLVPIITDELRTAQVQARASIGDIITTNIKDADKGVRKATRALFVAMNTAFPTYGAKLHQAFPVSVQKAIKNDAQPSKKQVAGRRGKRRSSRRSNLRSFIRKQRQSQPQPQTQI